jgi:hypothetical protein
MVSPAALAMLQAAHLVVTYQGHDGRGSGTDEWELHVIAPTAATGSIDDMNALKAAITQMVNDLIPRRNEILNVLVLVSDGPSKPARRIADLKPIDETDLGVEASERYEAIEDVRQFLRRFADAVLDLREGRAKKPSNLTPRPPYPLADEYDVQDALWFAVKMKYPTAQREDPLRKNTGSSSRVDFTLGSPRFGIEVKFMRPSARLVDLKKQLLHDLHDTALGSDLTDLFCFLVETKSGTCQALDELDEKVDGTTTLHIVRVCI